MTESQERLIYEWLGFFEPFASRDSKTGGLQWWSRYARNVSSGVIGLHPLPPLDYNTFMGEAVPRLNAEGVNVSYNLMGAPEWYIDPMQDPHMVYINAAPWLAVVEYRESVK